MSTSAALVARLDEELQDRVTRVMQRLALVSEASVAASSEGRVSSGSSGSAPPPGVVLDRPDGPLPKELSLAEHYRARFATADTARQRQLLCFLAERDLDQALRRREARRYEAPARRDERLLRDYEGVDALEAAVLEDCSETFIRKLRRRCQRDPALGTLAA